MFDRSRISAVVLVLFVWPVIMTAQGAKSAEPDVIRVERQLFDALKKQDAVALSKLLADDFQFRDAGNNPISKANFVKLATSVEGSILSVDSDNMHVQVYGDMAVLSGSQKSVVRLKDGKEVIGDGVFTDVFARRQGRWLLVFAHNVELPEKQAPAAN